MAASGRVLGYVCVVLSAVGFGVLSILIKWCYSLGAEPVTVLAIRFLMAAVVIWCVALLVDSSGLLIGWRDIGYIALVGPLGFGYSSILFFYALHVLDATLFVALLYTYPAMVNAGSVLLFRERLGWRRLVSLAMTFTGILLVTGLEQLGAARVSLLGVVLGLGSAALYAGYNLGIQRQLRRHPALVVNTYVMTFGTLIVLMVRPPFAWQGNLGVEVLAIVAVMVVFCTLLPVFFYLSGLKRVGAGRAAIVSNLEPLTTILLAILLLGERLSAIQAVGIGAVLGGVLLLQAE